MSSPPKILVVDDEANARAPLAELLREEGFLVDTAGHGVDALAKVMTFAPDVVISDLEMPHMDGIELVTELQKVAEPPAVIVLVSFGETSRGVCALRAGAADYLTKPIRFDELLVVLGKVIRIHDLELENDRLRLERAVERNAQALRLPDR